MFLSICNIFVRDWLRDTPCAQRLMRALQGTGQLSSQRKLMLWNDPMRVASASASVCRVAWRRPHPHSNLCDVDDHALCPGRRLHDESLVSLDTHLSMPQLLKSNFFLSL